MTSDNELRDVLGHHDELETQVQALRQRMLPLLLEAYPEVATALELMFESDTPSSRTRSPTASGWKKFSERSSRPSSPEPSARRISSGQQARDPL